MRVTFLTEGPIYRSEKQMDHLQINPDINSKIIFTMINPSDMGYVPFYLINDSTNRDRYK